MFLAFPSNARIAFGTSFHSGKRERNENIMGRESGRRIWEAIRSRVPLREEEKRDKSRLSRSGSGDAAPEGV